MSAGHIMIVGGSKGIGAAVAQQGRLRGWSVSVLSRSMARKPPPGIVHWAADLEQPAAALSQALKAVAASGPLDALIFCQRYRGEGDAWAGELAVSLTATRTLVEGLSGKFSRDGGSVVFVGSLLDRFIADDQGPAYHAAKAALRQLARYYAVSLSPKVRVNTVLPGLVLKDEARAYYRQRPALARRLASLTPLGRMGRPRDIADAVWFLCSPQAGFITGQDLVVDGGLSLPYPTARV